MITLVIIDFQVDFRILSCTPPSLLLYISFFYPCVASLYSADVIYRDQFLAQSVRKKEV